MLNEKLRRTTHKVSTKLKKMAKSTFKIKSNLLTEVFELESIAIPHEIKKVDYNFVKSAKTCTRQLEDFVTEEIFL